MRRGHWEYKNFFTGYKWRRVAPGKLENVLADRYDTTNKVKYVGPEVAETNVLADALMRRG